MGTHTVSLYNAASSTTHSMSPESASDGHKCYYTKGRLAELFYDANQALAAADEVLEQSGRNLENLPELLISVQEEERAREMVDIAMKKVRVLTRELEIAYG
jgi:hypothetical protein